MLARVVLGIGTAWVIGATIWIATRRKHLRPFLWIAGLLLLPLFGFLSMFQPQAAFYRTYELFFLVALALAPVALSGTRWSRLLGGGILAGLLFFTCAINFAYGWNPRGHIEVNPDFADVPRMNALPDAPLVFFARRENRQRILHAQYFLDRPVYVCEATHYKGYYSRGPSEARLTVEERTLRDWQLLEPYHYRLLFSQSTIRQMEKDSNDPITPVRRYVRCYDLVGGRPEPTELWVDLGQAQKLETLPAGSSGFVEVEFSRPAVKDPIDEE